MVKTFSHLPLTFPLCSILFCGCHIRFVFASLKTHCQMCHTEVIVRVVLFPCSFTVISPDTMRVPLFQSAELWACERWSAGACGCFVSCIAHFALDTMQNERERARRPGSQESNGTWRVSVPSSTTHHCRPFGTKDTGNKQLKWNWVECLNAWLNADIQQLSILQSIHFRWNGFSVGTRCERCTLWPSTCILQMVQWLVLLTIYHSKRLNHPAMTFGFNKHLEYIQETKRRARRCIL